MLRRVLKCAGLPSSRFHNLRHTFATLALQNGVDIKTISGMLAASKRHGMVRIGISPTLQDSVPFFLLPIKPASLGLDWIPDCAGFTLDTYAHVTTAAQKEAANAMAAC